MMRVSAVVALYPGLRETELMAWVERGWVRPDRDDNDWVFQEIDVARVGLVHDLREAMAVQEETMPLVLSLLDQVYALRGQMRAIAKALETQDEAVRAAVLAAIRG